MLLNVCKAKVSDLDPIVSRKFLLHAPFDRTSSRLDYQPGLFLFEPACEPIKQLFDKSIPRLSFSESCFLRANELLELDRQQYYLSWSGGIDSTCLLSAILQSWSPADLKRIKIVLTSSSISENPAFFANHLSSFPLINFLKDFSQNLIAKNALLVTGELGDQLFGSDLLIPAVHLIGDHIIDEDFNKVAPSILDLKFKTKGVGEKIVDTFRPICDEAPFKIRSAHDFFWWINFTQKWQHVKYRFLELKTWDLRAQYGSSVLHFYDTLYFQRWSLENHDKKIHGTWASYKHTAKDFIYQFTKNNTDLALRKVPSLASIYSIVEKRIAIDKNYTEVTNIEDLKKYVRTNI